MGPAPEIKQEAYLKINPRGQVPFIKHGEFGLAESNAILKYLCDANESIPDTFWPTNLQERARVDQFLEYYQFSFRPALVNRLLTGIAENIFKKEVPKEVSEAQDETLNTALDTFE